MLVQCNRIVLCAGGRGELGALVSCGALAGEAERAAAQRAKLHEPHVHNPYYDFLYALHINRQHYRKGEFDPSVQRVHMSLVILMNGILHQTPTDKHCTDSVRHLRDLLVYEPILQVVV